MKRCRLTITTAVDGRETELSCEGELSLSVCSATLCYQQDGASVSLILDGETAKIERIGDYSLRLFLKTGEKTEGALILGGNEGPIQVFTHRVSYSATKNSLLLSMHYDLLFETDKQEMKLRILARYI